MAQYISGKKKASGSWLKRILDTFREMAMNLLLFSAVCRFIDIAQTH